MSKYASNRSKEHNIKIAKAIKEKVQGENNPFYGKTHTDDTKQRMKESKAQKYLVHKDGVNHIVYGAKDAGFIFGVSKQMILQVMKTCKINEECKYRNGSVMKIE